MTVSFSGRVEALVNVPSGVTVSASNSGGGATSCGVDEDSYFFTAARTVPSLTATLQSSLNTNRAPSSGSWTVSVSASTGLCSIGCTGTTSIPSFSLAWTSTALRDILGFERDIDYAQTAADTASDIGYGTWSGGYLCNESSGDLVAAFGSLGNIVASSTPTYSNTGPRGGSDKAVGFDSSSDLFSLGDTLDLAATDGLAMFMVVKLPALSSGYIFGKEGTERYRLSIQAANTIGWSTVSASGSNSTAFITYTSDEWGVLGVVIDRSTSKARAGWQSLSTGTQSISTESTMFVEGISNAGSVGWGGVSGSPAIGMQIAAIYIAKGDGAASGMSANLGTAIANLAATFGTRTGTKQCRGLWLPDCVLNFSESYAKAAPTKSDMRSSQSPDGTLLSLVGNTWLEQSSCKWGFVPKERVWEAEATLANSSWEFFNRGTQLGLDSTGWFDPSSPVLIVDHSGNVVGINANSGAGTDGWQIRGLSDIAPKLSPEFGGTDRMWVIELPALVSSG